MDANIANIPIAMASSALTHMESSGLLIFMTNIAAPPPTAPRPHRSQRILVPIRLIVTACSLKRTCHDKSGAQNSYPTFMADRVLAEELAGKKLKKLSRVDFSPFTIKAFDCDNGGEFLNHTLVRYFQVLRD
jgi:hypothetical protein